MLYIVLGFFSIFCVSSISLNKGGLKGYFTLDELYSVMQNYSATFPNLELLTLAKTHNNREIKALRLVNDLSPKILIVGGHHARELISMTQVIFLLDHILSSGLNNREIWFIPVLNVEGLAVICDEFAKDPRGIIQIRKNMRPNNCSYFDYGVDLNRNYGSYWGFDNSGSSNNSCSEEYRGEQPFSEAETQAIKNLTEAYHFDSVVSYHSFGDMYIRPTGYTSSDLSVFPESHQALYLKIKQILPKTFRFGSVQEVLSYNANGSLMDYLFSIGVFTIEIEIGPEGFNSFHPEIEHLKSILDSHLEPFQLIYNHTTCFLVASFEMHQKVVNVEIENQGLAFSHSKEFVIGFDGKEFEFKMITAQQARMAEKMMYVKIPGLPPGGREIIDFSVYFREIEVNISGSFWPSGEMETGFNEKVVFGKNSAEVLARVIIGVVVFVSVLAVIGVGYICYRVKAGDKLEFVQMNDVVAEVGFR